MAHWVQNRTDTHRDREPWHRHGSATVQWPVLRRPCLHGLLTGHYGTAGVSDSIIMFQNPLWSRAMNPNSPLKCPLPSSRPLTHPPLYFLHPRFRPPETKQPWKVRAEELENFLLEHGDKDEDCKDYPASHTTSVTTNSCLAPDAPRGPCSDTQDVMNGWRKKHANDLHKHTLGFSGNLTEHTSFSLHALAKTSRL